MRDMLFSFPLVVLVGLALGAELAGESSDECDDGSCEQDCGLSQEVIESFEGRPSKYESVSRRDYERALAFLTESCATPTPTFYLTAKASRGSALSSAL